MDTLIVCTGNICRSPMAEGLLRRRYADLGLDSVVRSAGLLFDGREVSENSVAAMEARGIDITSHRSCRLTAELVESADLVVGMERQHVREAVVLVPDAFRYSFTLPELAAAATRIGPRRFEEPTQSWIHRASAGRKTQDLLSNNPDDEVADPYGRSLDRYERTAREIENLLDTVVSNLYPVPVHASPVAATRKGTDR